MHSEIARILAKTLEKSFVIIDEAHLVLNEPSLVQKLLAADRVLCLSATFGQESGLQELKAMLENRGARVATINPKTAMPVTD